ncbi:hypothetical protein CERZMDRAFT_107783 [Cercospora zeae-maydis SCOH1-5]|uniref:PhoD-like phosphatase domain-containing protein n=1 Tax=Cercospora zeae-maydis SCOH1-5 TaxID=717836 RepID=A0A6A6F201_9PEZI|nr:hypothetical protein CERZMDRAFT_107783 [Cercospora zeae-maydis SCOH1-5]
MDAGNVHKSDIETGRGREAVQALKEDTGIHHDNAWASANAVPPAATQVEVPRHENGIGHGPQVRSTTEGLEVVCGPLINYKHMSNEHTDQPQWHGSVLIVTTPGQQPGPLALRCTGAWTGGAAATNGATAPGGQDRAFSAERLYEDPTRCFWRYLIDVPFQEEEATWAYSIPDIVSATDKSPITKPMRFVVPSKHESMRIMFHSCNGFSVGTDMNTWTGPVLWNDVLRVHNEQPLHVMIGGGDQIYNDSVRVDGPLRPWTDISNPKKRRDFPFNEEMRKKCDDYYYDNYVRWYGTEEFALANGQIPQLNIWDDHDIIDGFGSYTDHFMKCSVFRGIGGVAHKYYLLFQHHIPPPPSTYSTDAPQTTKTTGHTTSPDAVQLKDTFVMIPKHEDPSWIIGTRPGPYVEERSRNIYCQLGKRIAFLGIDARTERTRHQINYPETYDQIFKRANDEIARSNGGIKHLILLLGVPIAYPRLQWLENIISSPIIGPIKFLNKRFGVAGSLFNQFDGGVDLLDDLDDHYTAHQHKKERKALIHRLQQISRDHSVRITILGGDVHLAALGRFYSKAHLNIPAERDFRYMPNIVSSAITNKPPPQAVANLLARRNKIHHLDHETDETLLEMFNKNPGEGEEGVEDKTAKNNHATMPSRNYAIITESHSHTGAPTNGIATNGSIDGDTSQNADFTLPKNMREPIHKGEVQAGTEHPAAGGLKKTGLAGRDGLDVCIRVEIKPGAKEGRTEGYGISIPALESGAYKGQGTTW